MRLHARWTGAWTVLAFAVATQGCAGRAEPASGSSGSSALEVSASVVISQVYGGGGNSGATFSNDYVELFNLGPDPIPLDGWSVQYASATGTGHFASNVTLLSGQLAPGQYYLVQLAGGTSGAPLPAPDAVGTVNMSGSSGKVALANVPGGLACNGGSTPCTAEQLATMVDLVGYGAANFFEGAGAAPQIPDATTGVFRRDAGCAETGDNAADFELAPAAPRNTGAPPASCQADGFPVVAGTSPAEDGFALVSSSVTIDFTEEVVVGEGWFAFRCTESGAVSAAVTGEPQSQSFTLDPATDLVPRETCTVTVTAARVVDLAGVPMTADFVLTFGIAPPLSAIETIQGAAHISPLAGQVVSTRGVVTSRRSNGFNLQDPAPDADGDDRTSDGILVFTGSAPTVAIGDDVTVIGPVSEFRPGCFGCPPSDSAFSNLTTTEIDRPTIVVHAAEHALPAPVVIGAGGRIPPSRAIDNDTQGSVEEGATSFDPAEDGIDFYESLEGMRVQVNDAVAVGPLATFGGGNLELAVVGDGGAHAGLRTGRGGIVIAPGDFNPERIILSNTLVREIPAASVGDSFPGPIVGVLDYNFGDFQLLATAALPALRSGGLAREVVSFPAPRITELDVAAFNVENLDVDDPQSKFDELAAIIVGNLASPDLLALEEIQDNDGADNSGTVDATLTVNKLVAAIAAAGGPSYEYRSVDPENNRDGGEPGGNIRVGLLFRTDRGLAFVDRPGASATTPNRVIDTGGVPSLEFSPGRIDPQNAAFTSSRKPLAAELSFAGQTVFVVANHWNSKGGDQPLYGRFQPPDLVSQAQREAQAQVVAGFVTQILGVDPAAHVIVLGDLNDFQFADPLEILTSAGLTALIETLPEAERYTYVFDGNSQTLDHVAVSARGLARLAGFDVVHVNAEFAVQASDHDPGVARFSFDATAPVITSPGDVVSEATGPGGAAVTFSVVANDDAEGPVPVVCSPASGSLFRLGTTTVDCSASDSRGNAAEASFRVTVQDTTPPALTGVPDTVAAFATSRRGARVAYALPTAADLVDGARPVACAPASGTRFAPGETIVTCAAEDAAGNRTSQSFTVRVTFSAPLDGSFYLPPLRPDGSARFPRQLILPVRFELTGPSAGIPDLRALFFLVRIVGGEEIPVTPFGLPYIYNRFADQYVFLLPLFFLQPGTYRVATELGDGVPHTVDFSVVR